MSVANTLAYFDMATITAVKYFIIQTPAEHFFKSQVSPFTVILGVIMLGVVMLGVIMLNVTYQKGLDTQYKTCYYRRFTVQIIITTTSYNLQITR
jgi:hypothetical protein